MMKIALFPSITNTYGKEIDTDWPDFAKNYLCQHVQQLGKNGELYAGAVYESGNVHRVDKDVIGRTAVVFDIDNKDCEITRPEDHIGNLEGITWAYHSTFTSSIEKPKFRIVIPLDRMVTPAEWPAVYRGAHALIANDPAVDSTCANLSRAYFRPAYHPSNKGQEFAGFFDGEPLSADDMIDAGGGMNVLPFTPPQFVDPVPVPTATPTRTSYEGRNDALKAQVAACMAKGKGVDDTVREVLAYDARVHKYDPLFTDPTENRSADAYGNALRFVTSIIESVNGRRIAQGLPAETPSAIQDLPAENTVLSLDELLKSDYSTEYLIDGYLVEHGVNQIFGESGHKKSFVALDMGMHVAAGKTWYGKKVKQGAVLYVVGEDLGGFKLRASAWLKHHALKANDVPIYFRISAVPFPDPQAVAQLSSELTAIGTTSMVILDTKARCMDGNENDTQDANSWISSVDSIKHKHMTTFLIVHHTGHLEKDRSRGAYSFLAALDSEYKVTKEATGELTLSSIKAPKNDEPPPPITFSTPQIETPYKGADGAQRSSLVLVPATTFSTPMNISGNDKKALDVLVSEYTKARENIHGDGRDPATAKVTIMQWKSAFLNEHYPEASNDSRKKAWSRVVERLTNIGQIFTENGFVYLKTGDI